jgi:hypothetical protein
MDLYLYLVVATTVVPFLAPITISEKLFLPVDESHS